MKTRISTACSAALWLASFFPCHGGKIHDAVASRDLAALGRALENEPARINSRCYPDFRTPLHMAVAAGDPAMVELLLDSGANPDLSGPKSLVSDDGTRMGIIRIQETPLQRAVIRMGEDERRLRHGFLDGNLPDPMTRTQLIPDLKQFAAVPENEKAARLKVLDLLLQRKQDWKRRFPDGMTPLHIAALVGDAEAVKRLLAAGADVNGRNTLSWAMPLHLAALGLGDPATIDQLIAAEADLEGNDKLGRTPLMYAAAFGCLTAVEKLIAGGAGIDIEDGDRKSAIGYAAENGHDPIVKLLHEKGGDDLILFTRQEELFRNAAMGGCLPLVEWILAAGVSVDSLDSSGYTPLLTAVERGEWELAAFLIEKGADKKATDRSGVGLFDLACVAGNPSKAIELAGEDAANHRVSYLFPWVAMAGRLESVKFLIARGAGVNDLAEDGTTALTNALAGAAGIPGMAPVPEEDYVKLIEFLVEHGAKTEQPTRNGILPIDLAAEHCGARVMKAILKAGGNPSPTGKGTGRTPLQLAAATGRAETVQVLLDAGADPGQLDHRGDSLLHLAASEGNGEVVKFLLERKLPVDMKNRERKETPLHHAVYGNSAECVRLLLAAGASPDARDWHNASPLIAAIDTQALSEISQSKENEALCRRDADLLSRLRIIHLLLEAGASTTVVPAEHESIAGYARNRGCPEIVELLENPPPPKPCKP